jgi:hypothetical protein
MGFCKKGRGVKVSTACVIPASPERVWQEIGTTRLLQYVCAPMQYFVPIEPAVLPERWHEGRYKVGLRAFGFLPVGTQSIVVSEIPTDANVRRLRDNGYGDLAKRWDHLITVAPRADGQTDYRDDIEVEAGVLTPFIWAYAWIFYHHRQRRWRRLALNGFNYGDSR